MPHHRATTVLVVGESPSSKAMALLDDESVVGRAVAPDEAAAAIERDEPDGLVVCTDSLPTAAVTAACRANVTVVDCDPDRVDVEDLLERVSDAGSTPSAAERALERRETTVTALHRAAPRLIDAASESTLFDRTVDIAEEVLEFDRSYLLLADGDDDRLVRVAGSDDDVSSADPDQGILGKTYATGEPFLVSDAREDPDARPAHETTRSAISVPFGDDGVFQALSTEPDGFDETDLELAELLMSYASATRDRIRSEEALRESRRLIERLHDAATHVAAAETEEAVVERSMTAVEDVLSFDESTLTLRDGEMLVPVAESADSPPNAARPMHISEGVAGKTARTRESFRHDRIETDPDANPVREDYRSAISVPIGDLGVFQATATEEAAFTDDDVHLAELLMAHVAVSLGRVRADADRRAERERLQALFENIPGAAIAYEMVDGEPEIRRVNEAFGRTFGYSPEEVTGRSIDDLIVPPSDTSTAEEYNERLERGERVQAEVERLTADGPRHFLMQVIPLEVGAENSRGYAIYSDVTERKRREEELRRQNERLDEFASVVSHDLRNPLNVASGYLELARETGDGEHFDRVEGALERMDGLITDLLVLAREGRDVGETESVALDEVAQQAWTNVATDGADLQVDTDHSVDADPDRLVTLFENLFRNSIEHGAGDAGAATDGGGRLSITVGDVTAAGAWTGFFVADDGDGVDENIDPFEAGETTSADGTGFGLAIVKSVAEAHGWAVDVGESDAGGARFEFTV